MRVLFFFIFKIFMLVISAVYKFIHLLTPFNKGTNLCLSLIMVFLCFSFFWYLKMARLWIREGNGTPLQYSCLENPMDGGAWWAAVHRVTKSQAQLSDFTFTFSLPCIGEGNDNPLQCSCLENPRGRRARWADVYGVMQSWTQLKWLNSNSNRLWMLKCHQNGH